MADHGTISDCADAIVESFATWRREFHAITRRAAGRFVARDWRGVRQDVVDRLDVYSATVGRVTEVVRGHLGAQVEDRPTWSRIRSAFADRCADLPDLDLAKTFFNSLTRRIFTTVGVDASIEFVSPRADLSPQARSQPLLNIHERRDSSSELARRMIDASPLAGLLHDADATAVLIAREIDAAVDRLGGDRVVDAIEVLPPLFYRGFGAYIIGRVRCGDETLPLAISFLSHEQGVVVDAVLLDEDDVSVVFSFTRSYFLVDVDDPVDVVLFLKSIMPRKPLAELYIALGYDKHGKTVLYRDLMHHLELATDHFAMAPGDLGMVMIVFAMPSYDIVVKVIRDRFAYPKTSVRKDVQDRYRLVFRHDRAGRLADAQEFEYLTFDRSRFSPELLEDLASDASETVEVRPQTVVVDHAYIERRMTPLNLYLKSADEQSARRAVLDYGRAVRDLAASNIFPGDMLLKNFGVTRHGRVIFYDYDELCLLTDCRFRDMPEADDEDDELRGEAWFYVGPNDIFPEEFRTFLGLPRELARLFEEVHGELFQADWWRGMQRMHRDGVDTRIFAYPDAKRLRGRGASLD